METPTTDWLHLLWAAVVGLFWKVMGDKDRRIKDLEQKVDKMQSSVVEHGVLLETMTDAIRELRESMKESVDESRKQSEALVRIETILQSAVTKGK